MDFIFLTSITVVLIIIIATIITGTYYGTRLPLGTVITHNAPAQAR